MCALVTGVQTCARPICCDEMAWARMYAQAHERERAGRNALRDVFHGSDSDPHMIRAARENATAAGLRDAIAFDQRDMATLPVQQALRGLAVCNPPYDARLAADPALYRTLGDALKRAVPQWRARSEEHTSELQSLMRNSYAVFCLT